MRSMCVAFLALAGLLPILVFLMARGGGNGNEGITVFCAASNRAVIEAIAEDYAAATGRRIALQFGASQSLLAAIEASRTGDLYLPADACYVDLCLTRGIAGERFAIGYQTPVIAVPEGNPLGINSLADLLASRVRLVQASPEAAAVGRATRLALEPLGLWDDLDSQTLAYRSTVTDVANDVLLRAADAGIVYDSLLHTYPGLERVNVPELDAGRSEIQLCVLKTSRQPEAALDFAKFITSPTAGLRRYQQFGYEVLRPSDKTPE